MKNNRMNRPTPNEPWVWLTRELLSSAAWRSMSINGRRVLDFLLLEWMGKGGRENGRLRHHIGNSRLMGWERAW